jgi:hypothetical protein
MSLRSAAEWLLLTTMLYAAGLVAFGECAGLQQWIAATQSIVDTMLFFVHPLARGSLDPALALYRHVLLVTVLLTGAWIWIGRRWLASWAEEVVEAYRRINCGAYPSRAWLDEAHGVSTLGAFGTMYLLFFDSTLNSSWAPFYRAAVFVVPLLCLLAFFLVCRTMVFHRLGARLRE